jgi:hypothetical protein
MGISSNLATVSIILDLIDMNLWTCITSRRCRIPKSSFALLNNLHPILVSIFIVYSHRVIELRVCYEGALTLFIIDLSAM